MFNVLKCYFERFLSGDEQKWNACIIQCLIWFAISVYFYQFVVKCHFKHFLDRRYLIIKKLLTIILLVQRFTSEFDIILDGETCLLDILDTAGQ